MRIRPAEAAFYQSPSKGEIRVFPGQCPDAMEVVTQPTKLILIV